MKHSASQQDKSNSLSWSLALLGVLVGSVLGYGVLSGDDQGQVNLLFLLLLFVVVPMLALLLSLVLIVRPNGRGVVGWILELPFWSLQLRREYLQRELTGDRKAWLVYQTQFLSLGFSLGGLLVYLLLLLATDISFIWRSTVLEAEQLLPALNLIATPWAFWGEAQASLPLLEQTRDFRLLPTDQSENVVGLWWRYVLAAQVCYNLVPRTLLLVLAGYSLRSRSSSALQPEAAPDPVKPRPVRPPLAELAEDLPDSAQVLDWAGLPEPIAQTLQAAWPSVTAVQRITADSVYDQLDAAGAERAIAIIVKAWEPPLAELADFLRTIPATPGGSRLLLPLDWDKQGLRPLNSIHLSEWRRFAATLENQDSSAGQVNWQVLVMKGSDEGAVMREQS